MDREEGITLKYLKSKGYTNIEYEPDGNIPPDFSIDGQIAIEVRRLNQHHKENGQKQSLEQLRYPLQRHVENMLSEIEVPNHQQSYFVSYHYQRPLIEPKQVIKQMKEALLMFLAIEHQGVYQYDLNDSISFHIVPATKKFDKVFVLGSFVDFNAGGFVVSEVY